MDRLIVLDANILVSAVLGTRVRNFLKAYDEVIRFCAPASCYQEASRNLIRIAAEGHADEPSVLWDLREVTKAFQFVDSDFYRSNEAKARERLARHPIDWPIVATALLLDCPIWTEDRDFFGCGIATWTTATVDIYFRESAGEPEIPQS